MDILHLIILALIQALTEFLPVSSSGHLALASFFFGWEYQGLVVDLALHFGTLLAVLVYFRDDLIKVAAACLRIRPGQPLEPEQRLAVGIVLATIPAGTVGVLLGDGLAEMLRHPLVIATMLVVFGLLLLAADRRRGERDELSLSVREAFLIGLAQTFALVPGTSRSGVTMTAALFLGLSRTAAARYSFLLSIPVISAASLHGVLEVARDAGAVGWNTFFTAAVLSGVFGFVVIHLFLRVVARVGATPFVVYRLLLALVVVGLWFGR